MPKNKNTAAAETQDYIKETTENRAVFHSFTEEEVDGLNEKVTELTEKKNAFAEKAKLMSDIAKGAEAEIKNTISLIKEGGEERRVNCPAVINYAQNTYTVRHPETGDILDERPLTAAEKQGELFPQTAQPLPEAEPEATATEPQQARPQNDWETVYD